TLPAEARTASSAARGSETVEAGRVLEGELAAATECSLVDIKHRKMGVNIAGDEEIVKRIEGYQAWLQQAAMAEVPEVPGAPKYVGVEACGSCHQEQLTNWKATFHAKAWETLEADPDGGAKDPECVSCHVSGYLQPGGARRIEDTKAFRGVQCESCHAPVATHPAGEKHGKVTEELCRKCHSETRDPEFAYETYLKFATCMKSHDPAANRVPKPK
ncbi:MAG: hypothetical protein K8T20_14790, partial [Planctomycetes bacterium]|nr:hypothetical protein [Planctomycetota bacterium]